MSKVQGWTPVAQPFSEAYYQREHRSMRALKPYEADGVALVRKEASGRLDGYLYKDFGQWPDIPILQIGGGTWMSITPMEVQSHYMPILLARGRVGVGGLGMGYAVQRMLSKPEVRHLTVYEIETAVIDLYRHHFGEDPRLRIVREDVRKVEGESFDFFYNDVYPVIADDAIWKDWAHFTLHNRAKLYHPWALETFVLAFATAHQAKQLPAAMWRRYRPFILALLRSGKPVMEVWTHVSIRDTLDEWAELGLARCWGRG